MHQVLPSPFMYILSLQLNINLACSTWTHHVLCKSPPSTSIHLHLPLFDLLKYRTISIVGAASKLKPRSIWTPSITNHHQHHWSNSNLCLGTTLTCDNTGYQTESAHQKCIIKNSAGKILMEAPKLNCKGNLCRRSTLKWWTGEGGFKVRVRNYVHHSDIHGEGGSKEKTLRNPFAQ